MSGDNSTQTNQIPPKRIWSRYQKLRNLAESDSAADGERRNAQLALAKLVEKWPLLPSLYEKHQRRQERSAAAGVEYTPPPPPSPPPSQDESPWGALRGLAEGLLGEDPAETVYRWRMNAHDWALRQVDEALDAHLDHVLNTDTFRGESKMLGLREQLDAEIAVEIEEAEADDGIKLVIVELEIPTSLVERLKQRKSTAGPAFLQYFLDLLDD